MFKNNKAMNTLNVNPPLTNVQMELLKLYSTQIPDEYLIELKNVIAQFLFEKARDGADKIWDKKGFNKKTLKKLMDGK